MLTVDAVAEAQRLVGPRQFEQLAQERLAAVRPDDAQWSAAVAAQIEMTARKIVDFYGRMPDLAERVAQANGPRQLAAAAETLRAARTPPEPPIKPNHAAHAEALAAQEAGTAPKPASQPPRAAGETPAAGVEPAHLDATTAHIEATNPDMLVHLDGMDEPMRVGDLMASLREEAVRTGRDSKLLEVAAQCAIRG
jgi:hypothetical protein